MKGLRAAMKRRDGWGIGGLTDDELFEIHQASLDVLQSCGVVVDHEEARAIFGDNGARVDEDNKRVKIPTAIVEDVIQSAPSAILMGARDPADEFVVQPGRIGFCSFGVGVRVNDPYTGELRESTLDDLGNITRLCDALETHDIASTSVDPSDVPEDEVKALIMAATMLENSGKHIAHGELSTSWQVQKLADIGAAVVGDREALRERPLFTLSSCPTSPLELGAMNCTMMIEGACTGLIAQALSMAMSGATAPVGLGGTLAVHNAEVLASLVLNQLTARGAPILYSASVCPMEMSCGTTAVGAPESAFLNEGVAELARYYLLPCWTAGG